jgi:hypothetical protein
LLLLGQRGCRSPGRVAAGGGRRTPAAAGRPGGGRKRCGRPSGAGAPWERVVASVGTSAGTGRPTPG